MKVIVKGVHVQLSQTLKDWIAKHLVAPLERFYKDESAAELSIHLCDSNGPKHGQDKECRVTVHAPHLPTLHVTEVSDDFFKSVCLARDRVERIAKRQVARRRVYDSHPV